jgi:hypothetical protein
MLTLALLGVKSSTGAKVIIPSLIIANSKDEAHAAALETINSMCPVADGFTGHEADVEETTLEALKGLLGLTQDEGQEWPDLTG